MNQVYIYQSCVPLATLAIKKTLLIQTEKVSGIDLPGTIFKDSNFICWTYVGNFADTYIPNKDFFILNFNGNYFSNVINIVYPDCDSCQTTKTSVCNEIYFNAKRCDNGEMIIVKSCDVNPMSTLKLTPTVGQVHAITNPYGDDFCVTLETNEMFVSSEYQINTPAWINYDCNTCPIYKKYTVNSCDGIIENLFVFDSADAETLEIGTVVRVDTDEECYIILSYDGIKSEYLLPKPGTTPPPPPPNEPFKKPPQIINSFGDCNECINSFYN